VTFDFPPVDRDRAFACIDVMRPMAEARGVSVARIAIAWLLHRSVVMSVIVGARSLEQLDDNLAATDIKLADEELAQLDLVSALPREYPGWMIERQTSDQQRPQPGRVPHHSSTQSDRVEGDTTHHEEKVAR
jgi:diketogulonate reductase-like aldo/keto reductase